MNTKFNYKNEYVLSGVGLTEHSEFTYSYHLVNYNKVKQKLYQQLTKKMKKNVALLFCLWRPKTPNSIRQNGSLLFPA